MFVLVTRCASCTGVHFLFPFVWHCTGVHLLTNFYLFLTLFVTSLSFGAVQEYMMTEHIRMSGIYWGLTAMDLLGHLEDMDADEVCVVFIRY